MANGHQCAFILLATPITFRLLRYGCRFKEWRESDLAIQRELVERQVSVAIIGGGGQAATRDVMFDPLRSLNPKKIAELSAVWPAPPILGEAPAY